MASMSGYVGTGGLTTSDAPAPEPGTTANSLYRQLVKGGEGGLDQEEYEKRLHGYTKFQFEASREQRFWIDRQWAVNIADTIGKQNLEYRVDDGSLNYIPEDPDKPSFVINKLMPAIEQRMARLLRSPPSPVALPASGQETDRRKARLETKIARGMFLKKRLRRKLQDLVLWADICGDSFIKTYWNPLAGDNQIAEMDVDQETGQLVPRLDETTQEPVVYAEGDVEIEVVNPLEVYPFSNALSHHDGTLEGLIHAKEISRAKFDAMFPGVEDLPGFDGVQAYGAYTTIALSVLRDFPLFSAEIDPHKGADKVFLMELWEKDLTGRSRGRHSIFANGKLVLDEETPEGYRSIPFAKVESVLVPGRYWSMGIVEYAADVQKEINNRYRQISWNLDVHGDMKLSAPRGHNLAIVVQGPDRIYEYNNVRGGRLEPIPPPQMPTITPNHITNLERAFDDIVGIHDVSKGQNAGTGIRAGRQAFFLQEQDETRLGLFGERIHLALSDVCEDIFELMRINYTTPRIVHEYGAQGVEVVEFTGEDLGVNTRFIMDPKSNLGFTRAERVSTIMEAWNSTRPLIVDENGLPDPKKALELMDVIDVDAMYEETRVHVDRAEGENKVFEEAIKSGQIPVMRPPHIYEEHLVHFRRHRHITNTPMWDQASPEQKQPFIQHMLETAQFLIDTLGQPAGGALPPEQGGPNPDGTPPNPADEAGDGGREAADGMTPMPNGPQGTPTGEGGTSDVGG